MSRTIRRLQTWTRLNKEKLKDWINDRRYKREIRGADGTSSKREIAGSAKEGVLNKWDDVSPGYGKRQAHKDIRNYYKKIDRKELDE